jgi:acid stress-induced BolA-like protein IbaG/YrbA
MALTVLNSPADLCAEMQAAIEQAIPGAAAEVVAGSPGHFQIRVTAAAFAGKSLVAQQQLVYAAIAHLMRGADAPVHAIDRLQTVAAG